MTMGYFVRRGTRWRSALMAAALVSTGALSMRSPSATKVIGQVTEGPRVQYRPSARVRVVANIVFARYGKRALKLDLYLPASHDAGAPGAIVIRGGGWMVNDRREFAHVASALAERGVVAASIEYRTADEAPFPAAIQDVKAAVRWMRANASTYGLSPKAIGVLGGSSGAYMALLAGLTAGVPGLEGHGGHQNISSRVQAIVAMAAPTDPRRLDAGGRNTVARFLHMSLERNPKLWARASPVSYVSASSPPALLLHSSTDEAVLPEQSIRFAELYRQAGATAELVLIPQAHHAFWNYQPWFEEVIAQSATFFHRMARSAMDKGNAAQ